MAHDLVANGVGCLAVNGVAHIPPPSLRLDRLFVAHIERLSAHIVVEGTVGERGVGIAVTTSKHWSLQPLLLPSKGHTCNRTADGDSEDSLDVGERGGVEGTVEDGNADDEGDDAEDQPSSWREIENSPTHPCQPPGSTSYCEEGDLRLWPVVGVNLIDMVRVSSPVSGWRITINWISS